MAQHVYVAERVSGFNFTVVLTDEKTGKETRQQVRFEKGQFKTDNDELAAAIDELLATKIAIRQRCRKTDRAAAEALALKHKAIAERTGAFKGGVNADATKRAMDTTLAERDIELRSQGVNREAFADDNLTLTEETHVHPQPVIATSDADGGDQIENPAPEKPKLKIGL